MSDGEKLNLDSIIGRLLEGKRLGLGRLCVAESDWSARVAQSPGEGRAADLARFPIPRFPSRRWNVPRRPRSSASSPGGRALSTGAGEFPRFPAAVLLP